METTRLQQSDIGFQANLYASSNPTRRWLHGVRRDWVLAALDQYSPPTAQFLEIGIGSGLYTRHMARAGEVIALDINLGFVEAVRDLPNVTASVCDVRDLALREVADTALCTEVIEHIDDSQMPLRNIYRALKPGGILILTTPNAGSTMEWFAEHLRRPLFARLARAIYREPVEDLGHINTLTREQLARQIAAAGFDVVSRTDVALYVPGLAEFGGHAGVVIANAVSKMMRKSPLLSGLLWTQCWVLRKPADA